MAYAVFEGQARNSGLESLPASFADADGPALGHSRIAAVASDRGTSRFGADSSRRRCGKPEILNALGELAPVIAVRGNVDNSHGASTLPETAAAEAGKVLLYVLHDVHALDLNPAAAGFHVVSGHSHQPEKFERDGVLYINPGSAGPRRFRLPVTVARLNLARTPFEVEFVRLPV